MGDKKINAHNCVSDLFIVTTQNTIFLEKSEKIDYGLFFRQEKP